jgi:general secretion pathway protein D
VTSAATVVHSGQASSVRSVKEMMYPQSYEPPELPNSVGGDFDGGGFGGFGGFGGGINANAVTPSHPTDFTTREIGVILDVTPTADLDNGCIDVSLVPKVVNFDGFIDWGSPIRQPVQVPLTGLINPLASATSEISANHIYMPVFSTHTTNTSVYVADGSTIVVGGMLQDRINTVEDRTPVFGSIPLVGRLFQSNVNQPVSTAVVFFVTVHLVDPTGQPLKQR